MQSPMAEVSSLQNVLQVLKDEYIPTPLSLQASDNPDEDETLDNEPPGDWDGIEEDVSPYELEEYLDDKFAGNEAERIDTWSKHDREALRKALVPLFFSTFFLIESNTCQQPLRKKSS